MQPEAVASGRDTGRRLGWTVGPERPLPLRRIARDAVVPLHCPIEEGPHDGDLGLYGRWLGTLALAQLSIARDVGGTELFHSFVSPEEVKERPEKVTVAASCAWLDGGQEMLFVVELLLADLSG